MTQEIKLPPLPRPAFDDPDDCAMFSRVQMTNYALAAVEADRKSRGEPKAPSSFVNAAGIRASDGYATVIRKLDAAFHAAVTFRDAAPTIKDSLTVAGAAKVPSDEQISDIASGVLGFDHGENLQAVNHADLISFARTLLTYYGQPAASAKPAGHVSRDSAVAHMRVNLPDGTPVYAAPVAAQVQAVVNQQMTTAASDVLADTQRAIIEAAERRGYERGLAECTQDREDAQRYRWMRNKCHDRTFYEDLFEEAPHRWDDIIDAARAAKERT